MTSYLSENEAKNLQNGDVHLAQIPDFGIEVSEGLIFAIFQALSFELNLFFEWNCPLSHFIVERAAETLHRMSPCTPVSVPAKITWIQIS